MTPNWSDDIEGLSRRLGDLLERANLLDDAGGLVSEVLEELSVALEEMQAQNSELLASRAELEHERERYRHLFEAMPDGYVVTDGVGMMKEVNATAATLFGRSRSQVVGKPLSSMIATADRRAFYAHLGRARHARAADSLTINLRLRGSGPIEVSLSSSIDKVDAENREVIRWLIRDRHGDSQTAEIRDSEERLRRLFDSAPVGIVLTDLDGDIVFATAEADRLLDRGPHEISLEAWLRSTSDADAARIRAALEAACDGAPTLSPVRHEVCGESADPIWVDHGITSFRAEDGRVVGAISTIIDVSVEHLATDQLTEHQEFTEAVLDTAALVVVLKPGGQIERFNAACEIATGFTADEMIGRDVVDALVPDDQRDHLRRLIGDPDDQAFPNSFETEWITADGGRRIIAWTSTAVRHPNGALRSIIGSGVDITEMRQLEVRLAQADRLESVGRLAAGLAHDFNNTLSVIQLRLDRMVRRAPDAETLTDLTAVAKTIDHTQQVIADLLSFSRLQRLHPVEVDLNAETARVAALIGNLFGGDIVIELELAGDETLVTVDPGRFEQVLTNLVINACDSMPDGGTITMSTEIDEITSDATRGAATDLEPGRYVKLVVTDTGAGISPEVIPHVFEPYFTTKPPSRGTGLGLATTFGTVSQTGGAITVDSELGEGATFTIWLPATQPDDGGVGAAPLVLVVDDEPDILDLVVEELGQLGCETVRAASGTEALGHLDAPIDVLVTDLQLPGVNGAEVAGQFRSRRPSLAVLFITGSTPETVARLLSDHEHVMSKPFTTDELAAGLRTVCARATIDSGRGPT